MQEDSIFNKNLILVSLIYGSSGTIFQILTAMQMDLVKNIADIDNLAQINEIRSIFLIITAFCTFPWAFFAEKIKRKNLLILSTFLSFLGPLLIVFLCTSYIELLIYQIVSGIGFAGVITIANILVLDIVPGKESGRAFSFLSLLFILTGAFFAQIIPSILFVETPNWRNAFIVVAFINFLSIIFSFLILEPKKGSQENALESVLVENLEYSYKLRISDVKDILKIRSNFYLLFFNFITWFGTGAMNFVLFPLFTEEFNLSPFIAMLILIASNLPILYGTVFWGERSDKEFKKKPDGKVKITIITQVIYLPCIILSLFCLYFAKEGFIVLFFIFLAGLFVTTFFWNTPVTTLPSIYGDVNPPEHRGTVMSLSGLVSSLGQGFGIYLVGSFFRAQETYILGLIFLFCISSIGILFLFSTKKRIPKEIENLTKLMEKRAQEIKNESE
ncbi:MAG: MFS transporter [archaeon]|nr:MFS transporter [archaeon]